MSGIKRFLNTVTSEEFISALENDGAAIIENFVSAETLQGLVDDLFPLLDNQSAGRDDFSGHSTRRLGRLFARSRHCEKIVTNPVFLAAGEHFVTRPIDFWVGEDRVAVRPGMRIGFTQAIRIGPGQPAQPLHRDDTAFLWSHPTNGREGRVQIMLGLSRFTRENGGTLIIPGSHKWGNDEQPMLKDAVSLELEPGSAGFFLGSVYHAGGANVTKDEYRTGLSLTLDASHVRQEENAYLSLPADVVASYPEDVQRLLGWSAGPTAMGWVEIDGQMADPINVLRNCDPTEVSSVTGRPRETV